MNTDRKEFHPRSSAFVRVLILAFATLACGIGSVAAPTPTTPPLMPTALPSATPIPTRAPQFAAPVWWPPDLAMPKGAEFVGDAKRTVWSTRDMNVPSIKDFFLREAASADYKSYSVTQSEGSIYDLYFVKGNSAYTINLTQGSDSTFLTGNRVGIFQMKVTGVANLTIDLPMRSHLDTSPGSEISIGTSLPNPECADCQYYVNVHIAPFDGIGAYDSKPGTYIIDIEVIPGGTPAQDDFRWAQSCVVNVKNASSGDFDCRGLQNVNDQSKKIDVSGSWTQP
jgi:hypothetical protein